jgi:hypothetical protein
MKYLNTKFKLFLENNQEHNRKYEIVSFTKEYIIENVYGGSNNINVKVKPGEKVKLYFDINNSDDTKYVITGMRPIMASENENNIEKTDLELNELWEGNFILDKPLILNKSDLPFKIEDYI